MSVTAKKPLQVYLRPDQLEALRALAEARGLSMAELVRRGVDRMLLEVPPEEDPLLSMIASFDTGPEDLAERHDDYLADENTERRE